MIEDIDQLKRTFGEFHVRFIDYGNTTVKHESKLFYLPNSTCRFAPQAIRSRLPIPDAKFAKNNMLKILKGFYTQCAEQGDTLGMEIYNLTCCDTDPHKDPHKVNLFINNVPLLTKRKGSDNGMGNHKEVKLESVTVATDTTVKFHVMMVDMCTDMPGFQLGTILFSYKSTLETIEKKLKKEVEQMKKADVSGLKVGIFIFE